MLLDGRREFVPRTAYRHQYKANDNDWQSRGSYYAVFLLVYKVKIV